MEKEITYQDLAERIDMKYPRLIQISCGNVLPYEDEARAICQALEATIEDVFTEGYNHRRRA
jgi:DNA-binding XRE family transcriptional regulator